MSDLALDFDSKTPSRTKRKLDFEVDTQCCFVTTLGRRCTMEATDQSTNPMCTLHRRRCQQYLKSYQQKCKGENDAWGPAKHIVQLMFGSLSNARQYMERHEQDLSASRYTPISMNDLDQVQHDLDTTYQNLSSKNRQYVRREASENYERLRNCWLGRLLYRKSCECVQDEGHVNAYYIYKAAVLVLNFVRTKM